MGCGNCTFAYWCLGRVGGTCGCLTGCFWGTAWTLCRHPAFYITRRRESNTYNLIHSGRYQGWQMASFNHPSIQAMGARLAMTEIEVWHDFSKSPRKSSCLARLHCQGLLFLSLLFCRDTRRLACLLERPSCCQAVGAGSDSGGRLCRSRGPARRSRRQDPPIIIVPSAMSSPLNMYNAKVRPLFSPGLTTLAFWIRLEADGCWGTFCFLSVFCLFIFAF